jgi:hypothetical protein
MADVLEVNAITGEIVVRDMTATEVEQRIKDLAKHAELTKAQANRAIVKAALLDRLGITADEAALLLG